MQPDVALNAAHWMYLFSVAAIILTMILRANVVVPSVIGTFLVVLAITGSPVSALIGIFSASFVAAKELFNIFLVITFMTALLNALKTLQADVRMVQPFRRVMRGGHSSFLIIALCTYVISLFFWPTPAVPLVSAILLPAAIAAGLPPLAYDTLYRLPLKLIVSRRTPDAEQLRQRLDQAFEQLSAKGEKVELN